MIQGPTYSTAFVEFRSGFQVVPLEDGSYEEVHQKG